ncbi:MAG: undecaprenyl/decaprenyl-phosphate alpha-N-acetylglucosaminyl 1-phosphate transferase [Firmicutes bacterium]|nr:undecaprenyl/decaprenyl-phosphate alpha-N-acetylglucosaminyl 1-phosphate transferase [Bacillota bacterium]
MIKKKGNIMGEIYRVFGLTFSIAFLVSLICTPLAIKIAPKIGAMDIPKDDRRMHHSEMPRFGGMAIFLGVLISMTLMLHMSHKMMVIMAGGAAMYLLGVVDDIKTLKAGTKFVCQIAIAVAMYMCNIRVNFLSNLFGYGKSELNEVVCLVVTVIWIVGITNTVNLVDGLDGLAAGTTAIASFSIAYVGYIHGMYLSASALLALAGGALGFLPFNFYPSKIFMGDSGSLFLGFMMSTLSVIGLVKQATVVAVIIPVLVMGFPIFDTLFAIFRRIVNRRPIMEADRLHLHHRLMSLGYGQRRATLMLYCVSGIMGTAAVTASRELGVETFGLYSIAALMIYIFLTDANHYKPQIKNPEAPPIADCDKPIEKIAKTETTEIAETAKEAETKE